MKSAEDAVHQLGGQWPRDGYIHVKDGDYKVENGVLSWIPAHQHSVFPVCDRLSFNAVSEEIGAELAFDKAMEAIAGGDGIKVWEEHGECQ